MSKPIPNSKKDLDSFFKKENFSKIFIICGKNSFSNSGAEKMMKEFKIKSETKIYYKKSFSPQVEELKNIIKDLKAFSPDLIIAIGGGSVIDYAKISNTLDNSSDLENEIKNSSYKTAKKTKLLVIPTTAGSGAEVTSNAVIYINKIKYSIEGESLKPDFFFLIPDLILGSSNKIKSSAGFDAIAQSLESLISKKSNDLSVRFAEQSLNISFKNYINHLKKPNYDNTAAMCMAANLSGEAINISKTTAPHAVSYPFTSIFNISHGHAVSLTLNKFLKFNYKNISKASCNFNLEERFNKMFNISKTKNIEEFLSFISFLKKEAELEQDFTKLGVNIISDYPKIISGVNILRLSNNPIELKKDELKNIIQN